MEMRHDCKNCKWAYKAIDGVRCGKTTKPEVKTWCKNWEAEQDK